MKLFTKSLSLFIAVVMCLSLLPMTAFASDTPSSWAQEDVDKAIAAGLVPQTLRSQYTQVISRAEFTAIAVALYETATGTEITERTKFNDTDDINVEKAAAIGVVSGVGDNNFSPDTGLTREQAATMLARLAQAVGKPLEKQAATFADNGSISSWALEAVGQIQAAGIMKGVGENMFAPQDDYSREQSIMTALRLYDFVNTNDGGGNTNIDPSSYPTFKDITPAIPDFTAVTGIEIERISPTSGMGRGAVFLYFNESNAVGKDAEFKKYLDVLYAYGFREGYYDSNNDRALVTSEEPLVWEESSSDFLIHPIHKVQLIIRATLHHVLLQNVTYTPDTGYPMYDKHPLIPDFGAIRGVTPYSAEANPFNPNLFSYSYRTAAVFKIDDPTSSMGSLELQASETTEKLAIFLDESNAVLGKMDLSTESVTWKYMQTLRECGFEVVQRQSAGGAMKWYANGFGLSVSITMYESQLSSSGRVLSQGYFSVLISKL